MKFKSKNWGFSVLVIITCLMVIGITFHQQKWTNRIIETTYNMSIEPLTLKQVRIVSHLGFPNGNQDSREDTASVLELQLTETVCEYFGCKVWYRNILNRFGNSKSDDKILLKLFDQDELVFIYMSIPVVAGVFTWNDLSTHIFNKAISELNDAEFITLLATGSLATPNLTFPPFNRKRVGLLKNIKDSDILTRQEYERALYWAPNSLNIHFGSINYFHIIEDAALKYDLDPALLLALVQAESAGNPRAVSKAGALGLAQLMPATARELKPELGTLPGSLFDPEVNIELGAAYLAKVLKWTEGHFGNIPERDKISYALAAYNAGWSRVVKANGIPNIRETIVYVKRVNGYHQIFRNYTISDQSLLVNSNPLPETNTLNNAR